MTRRARASWLALCLPLLLSAGPAFSHIEQTFACFVYMEPYEVRVEFVTTTTSLGMPLNFGFNGIDASERQALAEEAGRRLSEVFEIRADDQLLNFKPDQLGFVRKEAEGEPVIPDERALIPINEARISGIFVCPRDALPRTIDVRLKMFEGRPYRPPDVIPVEIEALNSATQRASVKFEFTAGNARQSWGLPTSIVSTALAETTAPPTPSYALAYAAAAIGCVGLVICVAPFWRSRPRLLVGTVALMAGVGLGAFSLHRGFATPVNEDQAKSTIHALLTNVYYAFAYRDESKIFDTLATSVDGPLLEELYLDIRRGLNDNENGGPSVRVLGVELVDCEVEQADSERLQARVRWVGSGTVSHWGHAHERSNQYRAEVVAEPIDGRWRLTSVTILDEERVQ